MHARVVGLAVALWVAFVEASCGDSSSVGSSSGGGSGTSSGSGGSSGAIGGSSTGGSGSGGTSASSSSGGSGSSSGGPSSGGSASSSGSGGTPWCVPQSAQTSGPGTDWGKVVLDAAIARTPTATSLPWAYPDGLFLHGAYLASKRLASASYLAYVKAWAEANKGHGGGYGSLDVMMPALVLDDMYRETMDASYGTAPKAIRAGLTSYPRTSDGAFWHNTGLTGQNWGDGVFMVLPQLVNYGELFADATYADSEAAKQLTLYDAHLLAPNKLHFHAYDEPGTAAWPGETMNHSCCEWCRAEGWYEMALVMTLDKLPATDTADRAALVAIAQRLAAAIVTVQDPATGRWWQVLDMPTNASNWLETSCSAMHTYFLSRSMQQGYIDTSYAGAMAKGFEGVLQEVSTAGDVSNICIGTSVGDAAYYFGRMKATNDMHGLGAFLIMYDQLTCR